MFQYYLRNGAKLQKGGLIMTIKHSVYFKGDVQSIGFLGEDASVTMTMGLLLPGEYDFGTIARKETIQIVYGMVEINGELYHAGDDPCVVEAGEKVKMSVQKEAGYVCIFD